MDKKNYWDAIQGIRRGIKNNNKSVENIRVSQSFKAGNGHSVSSLIGRNSSIALSTLLKNNWMYGM